MTRPWLPRRSRSAMPEKPSPQLYLFLCALSIAGGIVLLLATSRMGPGVSTDSARILSTAESLAKGKGLVDFSGRELTQFPPLYSLLQAVGHVVFGADVFIFAWALNVVVFAALIWMTGLYLHDAFPDAPILAFLGSFVVASSTSVLQISANISSDPLFMLLVLAFLAVAGAYLRTRETHHAVAVMALTIVSCFQRYAGLALVLTGGLLALYARRNAGRLALKAAGLFVSITAAPIFAWAYLHNRPYDGTVFGSRLPAIPGLNFESGIEKMLYWFIPHQFITALGPVQLLALLAGACGVLIWLTGPAALVRRLLRPQVIPSLIFLLVYSGVLIFNISYYELKGLATDRVHVVALPPLLVVLAGLASHALEWARQRRVPRGSYALLAAVFVVWAAYPISKTADYVRESMAHGDVSAYNSINKGEIRRSALAAYLQGLDLQGRSIYTNGPDTAWFVLRTMVQRSPMLVSDDRLAELRRSHGDWAEKAQGAYLVWIYAEAHNSPYATPEELGHVALLQQVYKDDRAAVYVIVSPQE